MTKKVSDNDDQCSRGKETRSIEQVYLSGIPNTQLDALEQFSLLAEKPAGQGDTFIRVLPISLGRS